MRSSLQTLLRTVACDPPLPGRLLAYWGRMMMCMLVAHVRRVLRGFLCADHVWSGCTVSNMSVITMYRGLKKSDWAVIFRQFGRRGVLLARLVRRGTLAARVPWRCGTET